ncbi:MAG: S-layer protein [Microcoleus sp. SIO2G3]|nr:S-layer protein [Microcoleus sp. SIO2G3]
MKPIQISLTALAFSALSFINLSPARAQAPGDVQTAPTARQVLEACRAGRAPELLPNPYTDVSPSDWAYSAVINMYYCGAFRSATPQSLIDRLAGDSPTSQTPTPDSAAVPTRPTAQ